MGEKGNVAAGDLSSVAGSADQSLLGAAGQSLVDAGQQLAGKVRDKSIDEVAKGTVSGTQDRLKRSTSPPEASGGDPPRPS